MPSALEFTEGTVFAGQFRIIKPLAQGGMGAVYVVEQLSTGKKRALKLMLPSAAVVDGSRRFEQEARTSSLIPSEHVVDVIAAGVEGPEGIPWLAMELLEGESLDHYLEEVGALSPSQAYELLSQLAHALTAAHDLGVVHRDLKPDNIFLARSRTSSSELMVKVLDFGLATIVEPTTKNTTALGSPLWMAPEQTQTDEPISLATDIWSLGLIVFRMLSGRYYWRACDGSLANLLREIVIDPLPSASQRSREAGGAELPPGFDEWFDQCVVRFAAYRFAHARDAWLGLQTVLVNAGATSHAARSPGQRPSAAPAPGEPQSLTTDTRGAAARGAEKTLRSPSDGAVSRVSYADLQSAAPPTQEPRPSNARRVTLWLAVLIALGAGAAYWRTSGRAARATAMAAADPAAAALPRVVSSAAPLSVTLVASAAPSVPAPPPSALTTPARSSVAAVRARKETTNAAPSVKPAKDAAKSEPQTAPVLPDLL